MELVYERCAGLDVHKKSVTACVWLSAGRATHQTRTFSTMSDDLLALGDWLQSLGVKEVAMESTGVYWKPVYQLLEDRFALWLVNAQHVKGVPGRKTDVSDAQWLGDLLRHGLLRRSFVPPRAQRELRELTRHRSSLVGKRAQAANELQKVLEGTNLKLGSVVSHITGVSAVAILEALLDGQRDPEALAELAKGRLRTKRAELQRALRGEMQPHHKLIVAQLLADLSFLEEQIAELSEEIGRRVAAHQQELARLDGIPGINQRIGEIILAEVGPDMSPFPSAAHLCSWAGVCPGNDQSGGRSRSSRSRPGNHALKTALVEAAQAAAHTKGSYLQAQYRRVARRRGKKRAAMAVARSILTAIYYMLKRATAWIDLGAQYFEQRDPARLASRLRHRLQKLGYEVTLAKLAA